MSPASACSVQPRAGSCCNRRRAAPTQSACCAAARRPCWHPRLPVQPPARRIAGRALHPPAPALAPRPGACAPFGRSRRSCPGVRPAPPAGRRPAGPRPAWAARRPPATRAASCSRPSPAASMRTRWREWMKRSSRCQRAIRSAGSRASVSATSAGSSLASCTPSPMRSKASAPCCCSSASQQPALVAQRHVRATRRGRARRRPGDALALQAQADQAQHRGGGKVASCARCLHILGAQRQPLQAHAGGVAHARWRWPPPAATMAVSPAPVGGSPLSTSTTCIGGTSAMRGIGASAKLLAATRDAGHRQPVDSRPCRGPRPGCPRTGRAPGRG